MKTLNAIIEENLRHNIDNNELCREIAMTGAKDPNLYDSMIDKASSIANDFLEKNFEYILMLAIFMSEEEEKETTEEEEIEITTEAITNVSSEDEDMLRFIEG